MNLTKEELVLCRRLESDIKDVSVGQATPLPVGLSMRAWQYYMSTRIGKKEGVTSDGSTASYYELPEGATELQHLISHRDMNAQIGEIFRACYRYGMVSHSPKVRDIKKIIFYAQAELERLSKL